MFSAYRPNPSAGAPSSELLKTVAVLCQAFQGNVVLRDALREASRLMGADVAAICRVDARTPVSAPQVLSYDGQVKHCDAGQGFDVSLAPFICGNNIAHAKSGSTWFGTLDDFERNDAVFDCLLKRRITESMCILLERKNGTADFLELHFSYPISSRMADMLEVLGPILSDIWKKRALGRFTEAKLTDARRKPTTKKQANILSIENPFQLSRSEYRVCLLLARGLNNSALLDELSITISTLRTHLRNIYLKTGATSQTELVHDLLSSSFYDQPVSSGQSHVA